MDSASLLILPDCPYRGRVPNDRQCYCRHPGVVRGGPARVPVSWCAGCEKRHDTVEAVEAGLGDTFANWLKKAGVATCGGCNQRREIINKIVPYNGTVR